MRQETRDLIDDIVFYVFVSQHLLLGILSQEALQRGLGRIEISRVVSEMVQSYMIYISMMCV